MATSNGSPSITIPVATSASNEDTSFISDRTKKQLKIVLGGVYFVVISTLVTRRAVARRVKWAKPTYFRQNMHHPEQEFNSGLEAAEAFAVATVNVFSWSIFFGGGALYATNTSGLDELKERFRVKDLSQEDREGAQQIVRSWLKAANPLNALKKAEDNPAQQVDDQIETTSTISKSIQITTNSGKGREG